MDRRASIFRAKVRGNEHSIIPQSTGRRKRQFTTRKREIMGVNKLICRERERPAAFSISSLSLSLASFHFDRVLDDDVSVLANETIGR